MHLDPRNRSQDPPDDGVGWTGRGAPLHATMIRIQFKTLDPDLMNLDPKHCSPAIAWWLSHWPGWGAPLPYHDPDSVYHAGSGSYVSGCEALLNWTRMMTVSMAWARSSTSRHHDPDSVYHPGSGSNESGSESLLTWTRMIMESMAWARSSTPATMIRIQITMLDPDPMNLDPKHCSPGPAWWRSQWPELGAPLPPPWSGFSLPCRIRIQ